MSEKKSKVAKKPAVQKSETASESKPTKAVKPRKDKAPKEPLVVFAIRLTEPERTEIHRAAGPRGATQFVRQVALAAAREDESAFRQAINDARTIRD